MPSQLGGLYVQFQSLSASDGLSLLQTCSVGRDGEQAIIQSQLESLQTHYSKVREGLALRKAHYVRYGSLHNPWARKRKDKFNDDDRVALVECLGGPSFSGNWSEVGFPLGRGVLVEGNDEWTTASPQTEDGRDFVFVGKLKAYHYIAENRDFTSILTCDLLPFYDPQSQIALTTFDWS